MVQPPIEAISRLFRQEMKSLDRITPETTG
jgi:hypothetical protein